MLNNQQNWPNMPMKRDIGLVGMKPEFWKSKATAGIENTRKINPPKFLNH
jgi:hypothetical protein